MPVSNPSRTTFLTQKPPFIEKQNIVGLCSLIIHGSSKLIIMVQQTRLQVLQVHPWLARGQTQSGGHGSGPRFRPSEQPSLKCDLCRKPHHAEHAVSGFAPALRTPCAFFIYSPTLIEYLRWSGVILGVKGSDQCLCGLVPGGVREKQPKGAESRQEAREQQGEGGCRPPPWMEGVE